MEKPTANTWKKKRRQGDNVFVGLAQKILDQSHIHHHFQLVEKDGTPCITQASVEEHLKSIYIQQKPRQKQNCIVLVVSTYCINNNCPNANNVQHKKLADIIIFNKDGSVNTRVWCDFCKLTEAFSYIIAKIFEKHPNKHFTLLHPDTIEGGCKCTEFIKEYRLDHIALNLEDGPSTRVWSKECAKSIKGANAKAMRPKGQNFCHNMESTRQTMLGQIEQLTSLSIVIDNIQQYRVYDILIRKASDTLGAAVQLASGIRGKNGGSASLGKMTAKVTKVLESSGLFIGQEMSRKGELLRVLVLPPSTLSRFKDIKAKKLYFNSPIVEKFNEFVFECKHPEQMQMQKMARLIEAHIADPTSLSMDIRTANAHMDNFQHFLEHIGIDAILKHHYGKEDANIRIVDDCQGDFVAFQELVEVKTLHLKRKLYRTSIKPMPGVDKLIFLVLADSVRAKTRLLFNALKGRRQQRLPCDDLISELENFVDGHIVKGIFKFVDPAISIRACPKDKEHIGISMSQVDGKVVKSEYIYDYTKASYIDTTNVPSRDLLQLIFKN